MKPGPMSEAMERMIKGRVGVITSEPFFGSLATKFEMIDDPKTKSTWTDGKTLGFNPEWVHATPMPEIEATVAHHVLSCAWGHQFRRGSRDKAQWQEASDYVVNLELQRAGFQLPQGALIDPRFDKMSVEQVYKALQKPEDEDSDGGGQGDDGQGGAGTPGSDPSDAPSQGEGDAPAQGERGTGGAGDGATGTCEDATGDDGESAADEAEKQEQAADWQEATAQAAQIARGAGRLPGGIERGVLEFLNSKVDWREALQRLLRSKAKEDYSWLKVKRIGDVFLPSLYSDCCGDLVFFIDGSGSINQRAIDQFVSEVEEARQVLKPKRVIVMLFDTQVRKTWIFGEGEPITGISASAGGGTAFDDPIYELERLGLIPEVAVYLTDLDSRVFAPEPEYPVVWVSTEKSAAPYGEVIMME